MSFISVFGISYFIKIDIFSGASVPPCQSILTSEHSLQISANLIYEIQKEDCLDMLVSPNSPFEFVVYCPKERLCGFGLTPNMTGKLNILYDKNCWTFADEIDMCTTFDQQLSASGMCFWDIFSGNCRKTYGQDGLLTKTACEFIQQLMLVVMTSNVVI